MKYRTNNQESRRYKFVPKLTI